MYILYLSYWFCFSWNYNSVYSALKGNTRKPLNTTCSYYFVFIYNILTWKEIYNIASKEASYKQNI